MPEDLKYEAVLSRLDARINWERRDRSGGWRVDLEPMRTLLASLGHPDTHFKIVHVAGSKGKGSTASLIARGLMETGERVGVYASPHVERLNERVSIDGTPIADAPFAQAIEEVLEAVEDPQGTAAADASWFDIVTAAALVAFRDAGVDWVVLEVGLGGRLDSTNAIARSEVSVVTMIALEHTAVLGDTKDAIAREKAGIIRDAGVVVTGCSPHSEAGLAISEVAEERGARFIHARPRTRASSIEEFNVAVARSALLAIGMDPEALDEDAVRAARLRGRMEQRWCQGRRVLMDGGHVEESVAAAFAEGVERFGPDVTVVIAVHREKSPETLLAPLAAATRIIATSVPDSGVHLGAAEVENHSLTTVDAAIDEPRDALTHAIQSLQSDSDWVLVIGSLYLVGALRSQTTADSV